MLAPVEKNFPFAVSSVILVSASWALINNSANSINWGIVKEFRASGLSIWMLKTCPSIVYESISPLFPSTIYRLVAKTVNYKEHLVVKALIVEGNVWPFYRVCYYPELRGMFSRRYLLMFCSCYKRSRYIQIEM